MSDKWEETTSHKLMSVLRANLKQRAAKAWNRFDKYLELFQAFALQSAQDVQDNINNVNGVGQMVEAQVDNEAGMVGMSYCFKSDLIDLLVDFVFGEKKPGDVTMGGSYSQPNFDPLQKVITACLA